jgi:flagellar motor switch protein FliN/FliY
MGAKDSTSASVQPIELQAPVAGVEHEPPHLLPNAIELVQDSTVSIEVRLGSAALSIRQVMELREGSVVELDRALDETVDVVLNGKLIARGQLVAHGDLFGVRITETQASS